MIIEKVGFMEELTNGSSIQKRLIEVKRLVLDDLDSSKKILQSIILDNKNDFYLLEINYISNIIREEELYQELTLVQKEHYNCLVAVGKDYSESGDYETAFSHYMLAKERTNHPVFDYYLGKMLYKQRKYPEALSYFQEYFSHGGEKLPNCLLYMKMIYQKQKKYKKANKVSSNLQKLTVTFKIDFSPEDNQRKRIIPQFHDHVKFMASKTTEVSLNEFFEEEGELKVENYSNYNFHQKLIIIRNLIQQGQLNSAKSYLNQLTPKTKKDKNELAQFQKNKKLYKNQRK